MERTWQLTFNEAPPAPRMPQSLQKLWISLCIVLVLVPAGALANPKTLNLRLDGSGEFDPITVVRTVRRRSYR